MSNNEKSAYARTRISLFKRYRREKGVEEIDFEDLVTWMIAIVRPVLQPDSWRNYRNAVCDLLEDETLISRLKGTPSLNSKRTRSQLSSSAQRYKGLKKEDATKIKEWASSNRKSQYAKPMYIWLMATKHTGIRPLEWKTARLMESEQMPGGVAVRVKTRKEKTNEDGLLKQGGKHDAQNFLVERTIDLSHLSQESLNEVESQIELVQHLVDMEKHNETFYSNFYKNITQTLYSCTRRVLSIREKYPTIYSARHQFASDLKARLKAQGIKEKKRKQMVAVMMGQGSVKTSEYNYGLTYRGDSESDAPVPNLSDFEVATGKVSRADN
ncbi:MAG: hypothetical protein U9N57_01035 [Pseudomonadota bacterium]|nr:hypothetical protein [Pseudomonadota bacterium]